MAFLALAGGEARLHLAIKDIDLHLPLDANADDLVQWGEVRARLGEIDELVREHLRFGNRAPDVRGHLVDVRGGVAYLLLDLRAPAAISEVSYSFHFDADASHRLILQCAARTLVLTNDRRTASLERPARWSVFFRDGMHHIWGGLDHILFLVALLLPLAMRETARWTARAAIMLKMITAFTAAHSLTLALAVTGWVNPPARFVESIIAGSVLLAALNNLRPVWNERAWVVAFLFGLFHGFGFAGPLLDAGLSGAAVLPALGLFNLGVEAGQLAIVAVALPVLALLARSECCRLGALRFGSMLIAALAGLWLMQRAFAVAL